MSLDHPDRALIPAVVDVAYHEDGVRQEVVFLPREPSHVLHERDESLVTLMQDGGDCLSLDGEGLGHEGYSCDMRRILLHPHGTHTGARPDWYCPPRKRDY